MNDSFVIAEKLHWSPRDMWDDIDFEDFCLFADAVRELNKAEIEAHQKAAKGRK